MDCNSKKSHQIAEYLSMENDDYLNPVGKALVECLENLDNQKFKILKAMNAISYRYSILNDKEIKNKTSEYINVITHLEGEFMVLETNLFPPNYYSLVTYRKYSDIKNEILYAIIDRLKQENSIKTMEKAVVIFEIKKEGRNADLDNYFCKPYVDALVDSKVIREDFSKNLSLIYTDLEEENQMIRITIINTNNIKKYKKNIFEKICK